MRSATHPRGQPRPTHKTRGGWLTAYSLALGEEECFRVNPNNLIRLSRDEAISAYRVSGREAGRPFEIHFPRLVPAQRFFAKVRGRMKDARLAGRIRQEG